MSEYTSFTANIANRPDLSIVVPCFNEQEVLRETNRRLLDVVRRLAVSFEIIYVDDGSKDETYRILQELQTANDHLRVIRLSRNFGHQVATTAGLEHAAGKAVVLIDADLQDPPEVISQMLDKWLEGWDVAYGSRIVRDGETVFKLKSAKWFYRLINLLSNTNIPYDTGDFRLMDRKVVDALLAMPERDRFLRGMISWVGFRQVAVAYHRERRYAGSSKYPLSKMLQFATDGIFSFSVAPLKLATLLGFVSAFLALVGAVIAVWNRVWTDHWVVGWTSLFLAVLMLGGVQLICVGIIGEYVGRAYGESKRRPLYFVQEHLGFESRGFQSRREMVRAASKQT
jgi:glycosyltransferase involved in cell wall biosynthesis